MSSAVPVVKVAAFVKRYKKHEAVKGVDLDVRRGELYGLIGPDGAGKSSLMKAIAGVLSFESGHVHVFGTRIDSEAAAERVKARIGFLPQGLGLNLYPDLSVEENIDFFAQLRLVSATVLAERKTRLLSMTRLAAFRHRPTKHLSGGMRQKLGLVCTLIHEPELAILDEPTTGVDPVSRRDFWRILAELLEEKGMTALVSTAYMDEAARFHRLAFLAEGRVLVSGTPMEVQAKVPGVMVTFQATPQITAISRLKQTYRQVEALGSLLHVFAMDEAPDVAATGVAERLGGIEPVGLQIEEPELEDVFVALLLRQSGAQADAEVLENLAPPARTELAIQAQGLVRDFGAFRAVDAVTFHIKSGEIFGLLGANGAGKTTVIKMLTGILPPTGGEGQVAGADVKTAGGAIKERIGYMSQAFSLYHDLTVEENIRLFAGIYGLDRRTTNERLAWIVVMAGLQGYESHLTAELPMGVRQRLALGCALVHRPLVLFLDEPTSGVDPVGRRQFWDILSRLAREHGVAMLITTHYMSEAEHCDRLALMYAGRIVAEGSPLELKHAVEAEAGQLLEVVADRPSLALARLEEGGYEDAALYGASIHMFSRRPVHDEARLREILSAGGVHVRRVAPRPVSLEDVFVHRVTALERQARADGQERNAVRPRAAG